MFRKPPIKTYQKKKPVGALSMINPSSIIREDIPENKELQPKEFLAFKDSDKTLEYDPFDTTFDRLVRDTKMPPILPKQADDSSYSSSSSDAINGLSDNEKSEPLFKPLPLITPKPATERCHKYKKQKVTEEVRTVRVTKLADLLGGRFYMRNSSMDENTEPNFEHQKSGKGGRKKKASRESTDASLKKKRRVTKKSAVPTYRGRRNKNINRSKSLRRCSVSLTRVSIPLDKSMAALNLENNITDCKKISEEFAVPGPSKTESRGEFIKHMSTSPRDKKIADTFKNPIVSLTRLSIPQPRPSIANQNWLNSTPIDRKTIRPKSLFRLSPISSDKSTDITNRNKDDSYDGQRLSPEKSIVPSKNFTPKNSNISNVSNLSEQLEKNSNKNRPRLLSGSPDPEPSDLMFEDTEILDLHTDFYVSLVKTENRGAVEASTANVFEGFTRDSTGTSLEDSRSEFRASAAPIGNNSEAMEVMTTSPLNGFTKTSTDSGSLHLTFECSDETDSWSKEFTHSLQKASPGSRASSISYESRTGRNRTEKNANDLQSSSEDTSKDSSKNLRRISKKNAKDRQDVSTKIAKDGHFVSEESAKDTSSKLSSDDEWTTIPDSPSDSSSSAKITQNTTADFSKRKFVVYVSSDDKNTSCDDIGEFVKASGNTSQMKFDSEELSSFEENSRSGAINESNAIADESSVVEISHDENLLDNSRSSSIQPVVLLSRLSVPIRGSRRISKVENSRLESPSVLIKSIQELSSEKDVTDVEKSINESQMASELIEWDGSENDESHESGIKKASPGEKESLKVDDASGNTTDVDQSAITKISDRNSSKGSFRWSMTEVGNVSERSLKIMEVGDTFNGNESVDTVETSVKKLQVEETSVKMLDKKDNRRSIQPIVLLSRLNDPIRITDRRKKYHNWGLSMISENREKKNVTTIEEEPGELETGDTVNATKKKVIENEPKIKLSDDSTNTWISQEFTVSCDASVLSNQGHESIKEDRILFLKPGKSWSRSLSLFRQVQSQDDLETLAVGKGKKWRQSVQSLLDMQQQRVIQSCVNKNEDDKESRSCYGVRNSAAAWIPGCSQPDTNRLFNQTSVGSPRRFVRRVSIRVVPDSKNSEHYEGSPFLEAYGITSSENRKTLGKRSTLIVRNKTLEYNLQCDEVTFESIPKSLNSVTSRDVVLAQCGQISNIPFDECYPGSYLKQCRKIGEGVFGEVFLYETGAVRNVIKIIPIEGELKVNGERQKKFNEILSEIVIAKELNNLRFADTCKTSSFVEVKNIRCVIGKYPQMLIDLWKTYDNEKNSENDCPDNFDNNQLYIVLELGHGGQDLEAFVFQNSSETHALFIQTALALAVAEESLEFEHRDLHWGNILISRTEDTHINYKLRNKDITVASKGVKVSVIDFTLSRMSYQGCSIFNDLSLDDDLFAAQGEYQFEIYRLMRQKVGNNWQTFEPYTNVLWLHYTLDKMITAVRYKRPTSKIHRYGIGKLKELKNEILIYNSALDFVTNCDNVTRLQGSRSNVSTVASTN